MKHAVALAVVAVACESPIAAHTEDVARCAAQTITEVWPSAGLVAQHGPDLFLSMADVYGIWRVGKQDGALGQVEYGIDAFVIDDAAYYYTERNAYSYPAGRLHRVSLADHHDSVLAYQVAGAGDILLQNTSSLYYHGSGGFYYRVPKIGGAAARLNSGVLLAADDEAYYVNRFDYNSQEAPQVFRVDNATGAETGLFFYYNQQIDAVQSTATDLFIRWHNSTISWISRAPKTGGPIVAIVDFGSLRCNSTIFAADPASMYYSCEGQSLFSVPDGTGDAREMVTGARQFELGGAIADESWLYFLQYDDSHRTILKKVPKDCSSVRVDLNPNVKPWQPPIK